MITPKSNLATYLVSDMHLGYRIKPSGFDFEAVTDMLHNIFKDVDKYIIYGILREHLDNKVLDSQKPHKIKERLEDAIIEVRSNTKSVEDYMVLFTEKVSLEEIGSTREFIVGVSVLVKE